MKNVLGIIVLARYNSSRLPGKALREIGGRKVLQFILERLQQVVSKDQIVMATSAESSDDPIAQFAETSGVHCFRGSLENVADRFYSAASEFGFEFAARINGDNIFVDTGVLKEMVAIAQEGMHDFISNVKNRTFPKGMSIEIVRVSFYKSVLSRINETPRYQEHVTLYLYEHEEGQNYYYYFNDVLPEAAGMQLALDTPEDFERSSRIIACFRQPHWMYNMKEILEIMKKINYA